MPSRAVTVGYVAARHHQSCLLRGVAGLHTFDLRRPWLVLGSSRGWFAWVYTEAPMSRQCSFSRGSPRVSGTVATVVPKSPHLKLRLWGVPLSAVQKVGVGGKRIVRCRSVGWLLSACRGGRRR